MSITQTHSRWSALYSRLAIADGKDDGASRERDVRGIYIYKYISKELKGKTESDYFSLHSSDRNWFLPQQQQQQPIEKKEKPKENNNNNKKRMRKGLQISMKTTWRVLQVSLSLILPIQPMNTFSPGGKKRRNKSMFIYIYIKLIYVTAFII